MENYEEDLINQENGIVGPCIFNEVENFHIIQNPSIDLMHDLPEGVSVYLIEGILTFLILVDKIITLETVNAAIANFSYGPCNSKPQPLRIEECTENPDTELKKKIKCKQSAAEMLILSRFLGLMIGDKIPRKNKYWKLYRTHKKVVGFLTAPSFVKADIYRGKKLIEKQNNRFLELLREIPPKTHIMSHAPEMMLHLGLLVHNWSFSGERKNSDTKKVATDTNSHKNVPLTIGINLA